MIKPHDKIKVLIITNGNNGVISPFVKDQFDTLSKIEGVEIDIFYKVGKGIFGYLSNLRGLKKKINQFKPDIVHAHYGLTGLLANLQRKVPVVTTYHGSDIHSKGLILFLSRICMRLSAFNIFVSQGLYDIAKYKKSNNTILSCGVDLKAFPQIRRDEARYQLGWDKGMKYILFSARFDNNIKNYPLAKEAVSKVEGVTLVEFKGFPRERTYLPMNACDLQLTTSFRESGPLVVKEALACGTPVVTVDVGDVREVIGDTEGCYICNHDADELAAAIKKALQFKGKTKGRERIEAIGLSNDKVANRLVSIYKSVFASKH